MKPTLLLLTCLIGLAVPRVGLAQPTITNQPGAQATAPGTTATFQVGATGKGLNETTISGTVFAPNGTLALYGATVYIPNGDPGPLVQGATCSSCVATLPGGSVANALSDPAGKFTLTNVPTGHNVPLVIQLGKWRRVVSIPEVTECTDNELPAAYTSLPKNKDEGDMPRIAIVTGACDALECLVRKIGVEDSEFTSDSGTGRIHMFDSLTGGANQIDSSGEMFAPVDTLMASVEKLKQYDIAMFSCECHPEPGGKTQGEMDRLKAYADLGGRVFLMHYQAIWIDGEKNTVPPHEPAVWPTIADFPIDNVFEGDTVID